MVCLLLQPICKCYSEYIFICQVSDIIQTFVCVFVKFASVIFFHFSLSFLRGMLNKNLKSSLRVTTALVLEKSKSQVTGCFSKDLMCLVSIVHGD